ncbi:unnamed protein product, partial [Allacma fusca]
LDPQPSTPAIKIVYRFE